MGDYWMPLYLDEITKAVNASLRRRQRAVGLAIFLELIRRAAKLRASDQPGKCVAGRDELAACCNSTSQTVRTVLNALRTNRILTIESTSRGTSITIRDLGRYVHLKQQPDHEILPASTANQPATNQPPPRNQPLNRNKEKEREKKNIFVEDSVEYRLASLLYDLILRNNPGHMKPDLKKWAHEVDLMLRRDGRTPEKVEEVMRWAQADDFWKANILSPCKLREKYDQLAIRMQRDKRRQKDGDLQLGL
ncbi:MAG: hypothetical protein HY801_02120 [Candidatus Lindowbacteria bacterium]|nr:hypothetical protein [Candidatus Lindowbacteria bacterium]